MPYKIDPKTKKKVWISEADIPATPEGKPSPEFLASEEQVKRRKMMEAERRRTQMIREGFVTTPESEQLKAELEKKAAEPGKPILEEPGTLLERTKGLEKAAEELIPGTGVREIPLEVKERERKAEQEREIREEKEVLESQKKANQIVQMGVIPATGVAGAVVGIGGIIGLLGSAYAAYKFVRGIGEIPGERIADADTAMSQLRETVSLIPQGVTVGVDPFIAISQINDVQAELERQHDIVKYNEQIDPDQLAHPGAADAANLRYEKIKIALDNAERMIINYAAYPTSANLAKIEAWTEMMQETSERRENVTKI